MEIILLSDVENVGQSGDIINVKPGFARNKLIPQGLALRASNRNVAIAKEKKKTASAKLERETQALKLLAKKLSDVEITIEVKVGDEEKMFGSITNKDVHKELVAKGFELDKTQISIKEPIKALGIFHANVKITKDITSDVKLYVIKG
ncbi:MAG: 50S ribosomal protein L9 [Candidatus Marinimicrobia bacterium]|nr:50S ribosomal protein L9 [Candidatus Neomarinimicrobiota bacterium]|tara:strand:+ start:306 stop:749 length:444 start_codon:yes stop_codon:yes gene_type:complete